MDYDPIKKYLFLSYMRASYADNPTIYIRCMTFIQHSVVFFGFVVFARAEYSKILPLYMPFDQKIPQKLVFSLKNVDSLTNPLGGIRKIGFS